MTIDLGAPLLEYLREVDHEEGVCGAMCGYCYHEACMDIPGYREEFNRQAEQEYRMGLYH